MTKCASHEDALQILQQLGRSDVLWFTDRDTRDGYATNVHEKRRDIHSRKCFVIRVRFEEDARGKRLTGRELIGRSTDFVIEEGIIAPLTGRRILRQAYEHWRRWPKRIIEEIHFNCEGMLGEEHRLERSVEGIQPLEFSIACTAGAGFQ